MCAGSGGRLRALCQVPAPGRRRGVRRARARAASGHAGVHIGNHVGPRDLDDAELVAFLQCAADLGAPVLVHPWDMDPVAGRLDQHMMGWTVGMPLETHLSIVSMVLGGAFDKLPPSLKLCFAHGGGAFPFLLGRLENARLERSVARGKSLHPPSHYLDRFSVDSAVFDDRALKLLVDTMGAGRVMLGSDYPFPLGEQQIGSLVRSCPTLSSTQKSMILGANAADFFGLEYQVEVAAPTYVHLLTFPPLDVTQNLEAAAAAAGGGARRVGHVTAAPIAGGCCRPPNASNSSTGGCARAAPAPGTHSSAAPTRRRSRRPRRRASLTSRRIAPPCRQRSATPSICSPRSKRPSRRRRPSRAVRRRRSRGRRRCGRRRRRARRCSRCATTSAARRATRAAARPSRSSTKRPAWRAVPSPPPRRPTSTPPSARRRRAARRRLGGCVSVGAGGGALACRVPPHRRGGRVRRRRVGRHREAVASRADR